MKVLIFSMYDHLSASTRQRYSQFINTARKDDIIFEIKPLLSNSYLINKFKKNKISKIYVLKRFIIRLFNLLTLQNKSDLLIIQFELFPYLPYFFERLLLKKKYICDFDDAFHLRYENLKILKIFYKNKFSSLITNASLIFAGSDYLYNYSLKYNHNTVLLPTSVDINRYKNIPLKKKKFTIGWIGSPSTARYLSNLNKVFIKLSKLIDFRLMIIGGEAPMLPNIDISQLEWTLDSEIELINIMDVGIMPLNNNEWEKGKCSYKLIQYMACEIPVIASPVGFNLVVIDHEVNGYLADNEEQWIKYILNLYNSKDLRTAFGKKGRIKVTDNFSSDLVYNKIKNNLNKINLSR